MTSLLFLSWGSFARILRSMGILVSDSANEFELLLFNSTVARLIIFCTIRSYYALRSVLSAPYVPLEKLTVRRICFGELALTEFMMASLISGCNWTSKSSILGLSRSILSPLSPLDWDYDSMLLSYSLLADITLICGTDLSCLIANEFCRDFLLSSAENLRELCSLRSSMFADSSMIPLLPYL